MRGTGPRLYCTNSSSSISPHSVSCAPRPLPDFVASAPPAALLADEVLPERPLRQWVLSLPHALRFLLATNSQALTLVLGEVYRAISRHLIDKAGLTRTTGATGAVTLVQRFGSALNLNVHFHMLFLDGAYQTVGATAAAGSGG